MCDWYQQYNWHRVQDLILPALQRSKSSQFVQYYFSCGGRNRWTIGIQMLIDIKKRNIYFASNGWLCRKKKNVYIFVSFILNLEWSSLVLCCNYMLETCHGWTLLGCNVLLQTTLCMCAMLTLVCTHVRSLTKEQCMVM